MEPTSPQSPQSMTAPLRRVLVKRPDEAFGSADPAYYGIRARMLNGSPSFGRPASIVPARLPGYVAVSATIMSGVNFDEAHRDYYKPLLAQPRVASIGHTIDVYWVDRPWW